MKILFATTNPAKVKTYASRLIEKGYEIVTLKDLKIDIDVEENGTTPLENAIIKAKEYHKISNLPTIAMDEGLYLDGVPENLQPGTHVRRVNGKELNDDEMIKYYSNLVKEYGGKLTAKWVYGMAIYNGKEEKTYTWNKDHFYFIDKPSQKRNTGYPLDSITIVPEFNKYLVELTEEEKNEYKKKNNIKEVVDFIVNNI